MHALEDEPEKEGRWRRLGSGALIAVVIGGGMMYGATKVEGTRRLLQKVVTFTVVEEKPKVEENTPPPPPPPPRKKQPPPPKANEETPPEPEAKEVPPEQQQVGMDQDSFAEGGNGVGFAVGNTQMGVPGTRRGSAPKKPKPAPVLRPAKQLKASAMAHMNKLPEYNALARRRGVQGVVIVALKVDTTGHVTNVRVETGLDPEVDRAVASAVKDWRYEPATLEGRPVSSTVMARFRFQLARG